jgi:phosphoglycolate phosphatase-like HAD superfamily hydrolase
VLSVLFANPNGVDELLSGKEVFVFDWDGTILDSMEKKARNFAQAFCSVAPVQQGEGFAHRVAGHYLRLSGHSRKHIFLRIVDILGMEAEPNSFVRFNEFFEKLNKGSLIHARIFPDALELLEELSRRGHKIYISSSVPPQELSELVELTLPAPARKGISSIFGSKDGFAKGNGHIQAIVQETHVPRDRLLVFGDDVADYELSTEAGVDFILVNRTGIPGRQEIKMVSNLYQIKDRLPI